MPSVHRDEGAGLEAMKNERLPAGPGPGDSWGSVATNKRCASRIVKRP